MNTAFFVDLYKRYIFKIFAVILYRITQMK